MSRTRVITGSTLTIARIPTMINERKITANLALISLSVKVSAPRRGMNTDPSTNEMTKETAILDTTKEER